MANEIKKVVHTPETTPAAAPAAQTKQEVAAEKSS